MLLSTQSERNSNGSESTPNAIVVREQLKRLLAHPLFTNSKRYPVLLAYTVEQALLGNAGLLKERTIGVEAFGREPNYDVNLDPVVRITAAEVRKRLIQYYYSPDHAGEVVIELSVGSYVPTFREPATQIQAAIPVSTQPVKSPAEALPAAILPQKMEAATFLRHRRNRLLVFIAMLLAAGIGFGAGHIRWPKRPSNIDRFWEPITATSGRVTYCLGEPIEAVDRERRPVGDVYIYGSLNVYDVTALGRSIVPLVSRNGAFRVTAASSTSFSQLREGPFVLIGAFDNAWTMRITQNLPFGFETTNDGRKIVDRKSAQKRSWSMQWQISNTHLVEDYAVVARMHDSVTGQPVILLAGILGEGTEAASEVVSNPAYLDALLQKAPKNWDHLNMEAVIETHVIDGHAGPPSVIALETW